MNGPDNSERRQKGGRPLFKTKVMKNYQEVPLSGKDRREPEVSKPVIGIWHEPYFEVQLVYLEESGYWFLVNDTADCDEPDYWLEEIES